MRENTNHKSQEPRTKFQAERVGVWFVVIWFLRFVISPLGFGSWFLGFFLLSGSLVVADDSDSAARQARLAAMRQRAEALQLKVGERPELRRVGKEPLFRYSDAARTTTDGTLWLWTQAERPIAARATRHPQRPRFRRRSGSRESDSRAMEQRSRRRSTGSAS